MRFRLAYIAATVLPGLVVGTALVMHHRRVLGPTAVTGSSIATLFEASASAGTLCPAGVRTQSAYWKPVHDQGASSACDGAASATDFYPYNHTVYCDGRSDDSAGNSAYARCFKAACSPQWLLTVLGGCTSAPEPSVTCDVANCLEPDPCPGPDCVVGHPVSVVGDSQATPLGQGAAIYSLSVFPLGEAGFPPAFSVSLLTQNSYPEVSAGVLGTRATHSLAPQLVFSSSGSPSYVRASTEDGSIQVFKSTGTNTWTGLDGRLGSLSASTAPTCAGGSAVMTMADGTKYTFSEYCNGSSLGQGQIQRIDRPNGDYETFSYSLSADTRTTTVTNRRGAHVTLQSTYSGELSSVTAPDGTVFTFSYTDYNSARFLTGISNRYTLNYSNTSGGSYYALSSVLDALGNTLNAWTYTDSNSTRVLTEQGPGSASGNTLTFSYSAGQTTVAFTGPDNAAKTNTYNYASQFSDGERARITSRSLQGACPNCGDASLPTVTYWTGTTFIRTRQDANGFYTVFEDLANHAGAVSYAYDSLGNPLVVYSGCTDTSTCSGGLRKSYTYLSGTNEVLTATRPSARAGYTVTETRAFTSTSSRLTLDSRQGYTASSLAGALDALKTRSTVYAYGGGAGGLELSAVQGPFDDAGSHSPPSDAPETDFVYYVTGTADLCTGSAVTANTSRLKSVIRKVDASSRALVTNYCQYDGAGRPGTIVRPGGSRTSLVYNSRGQVTSTTVDSQSGGLSLTTDTVYDAAGNLTDIKLPRTTQSGTRRTAYHYRYDDANRILGIEQGYFVGSAFTALQSISYTWDAWGNRLSSQLKNGSSTSGTTITSESSTYDAFSRLATLARPSGDANRKTSFGYDLLGHLIDVHDKQGDDVFYGSQGDITKYDKFGKLTLVEQEICQHSPSDPNDTCGSPRLANVRYGYDNALQLNDVQVDDAVRGGTIETGYITDDFGSVVKVTSPDSGVTTYTYDGSGRLASSQDARGKIFQFVYDRIGRLTIKKNATAVKVTATNGTHGTTVVNASGTITYTPNTNYSGADSYTYTLVGRNGHTTTNTVSVTVQ